MERWSVRFLGRVQGVGFRYTTASIAKHYSVKGYVQNMPDGSVELVVEGTVAELGAFLGEIQSSMEGNIADFRIDRSTTLGGFQNFEIRY